MTAIRFEKVNIEQVKAHVEFWHGRYNYLYNRFTTQKIQGNEDEAMLIHNELVNAVDQLTGYTNLLNRSKVAISA